MISAKSLKEPIQKIIERLDLRPLETEGGFFKETYRSREVLDDGRNLATAIYYLITRENHSRLHKLKADEIYHFYQGDPVEMLNLYADGTSSLTELGSDVLHGMQCQFLVPKDTWQAMRLKEGGSFALMGTTMSPGFETSTLADGRDMVEDLVKKYPDRKGLILFFTS